MNPHTKSLLISLLSAIITFAGYLLIELQSIDFGGIDPLVLKTLVIGVCIRSLIKIGVDSIEQLKKEVPISSDEKQ